MTKHPKDNNLEKVMFERREFIRIPGNFVVSYQDVSNSESKVNITQTKNISIGGILFTTDEKFEPGTILRLKLRLPDVHEHAQVKVQVVGSVSTPNGLLSQTRVKFIGIRDEDRAAIAKIVQYHASRKQKGVR